MLPNTKPNTIALSFDVEDWFTVRNMREVIQDKDWDAQQLRVDIGLNFILKELAERNIKATFFVLGWIADRCPQVVIDIAHAGHEVASHGYSHTPIDLMTPEEFAADLKKSLVAIERITGRKVKGYRAPSFSITKKTAWALEIIKKCGLEYDSSIFSTIHPDYGINNFPTNITSIRGLLEVPLRKGNFYGAEVPVCGGGYFRMLPYTLIKSTLKQTLKSESLVMYFHPWEFDPAQPKVDLPALKKFRHYVGLGSNKEKFISLLNDFNFTTIANLISGSAEVRPFPALAMDFLETPQALQAPSQPAIDLGWKESMESANSSLGQAVANSTQVRH